jgi:ParB-like chromosome segregation protein Spo0J
MNTEKVATSRSIEAGVGRQTKMQQPGAVPCLSEQKIELCPLSRLTPYKNNARTHSKKQIRQIAKSIKRFGFTNPVLIDDAGEIIAGHGRVEAAKLLGLAAVPTIRLSHLSETEKRAYILADNRLAEKAGWDREILAIELQGLIELDFDVELTGFSTAIHRHHARGCGRGGG